MFLKRDMVFIEGRPPSSMGQPSLSLVMRRCAPRHFSVDLALSRKAGGMGLLHEAVQIWILLGWSSRLMVMVGVGY